MALIKCKDCQKEFSTDARRCPSCGAKKPKEQSSSKKSGFALKAFLFLMAAGFIIPHIADTTDHTASTTATAPEISAAQQAEIDKEREEFKKDPQPLIKTISDLISHKDYKLALMKSERLLDTQNPDIIRLHKIAADAIAKETPAARKPYNRPVTEKGTFMCARANDVPKFMTYVSEGNQTEAMKMMTSPTSFGENMRGCMMLTEGEPIRIVHHDSFLARVEFRGMFGYAPLLYIGNVGSKNAK